MSCLWCMKFTMLQLPFFIARVLNPPVISVRMPPGNWGGKEISQLSIKTGFMLLTRRVFVLYCEERSTSPAAAHPTESREKETPMYSLWEKGWTTNKSHARKMSNLKIQVGMLILAAKYKLHVQTQWNKNTNEREKTYQYHSMNLISLWVIN